MKNLKAANLCDVLLGVNSVWEEHCECGILDRCKTGRAWRIHSQSLPELSGLNTQMQQGPVAGADNNYIAARPKLIHE